MSFCVGWLASWKNRISKWNNTNFSNSLCAILLQRNSVKCFKTLASNSFMFRRTLSRSLVLFTCLKQMSNRSARLVQNNRSIAVLTFLETCDLFLYSKYNRAIRRPVQSRHDAFKNFTHSTFHKMRVSGTPELGYKILAIFSNLVEIQTNNGEN